MVGSEATAKGRRWLSQRVGWSFSSPQLRIASERVDEAGGGGGVEAGSLKGCEVVEIEGGADVSGAEMRGLVAIPAGRRAMG